jgi:peptidoglycan/xylan/chitin deacetylase (PgdA/CDA1 family)
VSPDRLIDFDGALTEIYPLRRQRAHQALMLSRPLQPEMLDARQPKNLPRQRAPLPLLIALFFLSLGTTARTWNGNTQVPAANELGRFLILEYHLVQEQETRWGRSISNFKQDLERLYQGGYRPVAMADVIDGNIDLPAGTKPVLLTFDDSSPGQFRYLVRNGKKEIDPDCAVGLLLSFHRQHPDWGRKAVFFVLPEAKQPHKLFGQREYEQDKLKELVALGFEIGNHTLWHANLGKYDDTTVQKQLALSVAEIQKRVPGYAVRALALPFGVYPADLQLAVKGEFKGSAYRHEAILMVAGGAAPSPFSTGCDLLHLPRIQVPGPDLKYWLAYYERHPGEVFVSDGKAGTVTFPKALQPKFSASKFKKLQAVPY